jgi:hypothetical protein
MMEFGLAVCASLDLTQLHGLPYAISETGTIIVFAAVTLREFFLRLSAAFELSPNWPIVCARVIIAFLKGVLKK